ncbi:MAG: aldo/keto reductase [Candidatus Brocadiia bacterium]
MERLTIPGTDLEVSQVCYGTAGLGTAVTGSAVDELLNTYRHHGGNFLDTAHCYGFWAPGGNGASERAIGEYLKRHPKDDLIVATKGGHPGRPGYRKTDRWLSRCRVQCDIDDSLGRLELDTIDLFWLHRDDTRMDVGEVIETLNEEIRRGRIRYLGASNWTVERIEAANTYAEEKGLHGFVASQVEWSLAGKEPADRTGEHGDYTIYAREGEVAFHEHTGLPLVAYTATARGYFAPDTEKRADFDNPVSRGRLERAEQLAEKLGVTANQVALAWLMNQSFPAIPITGTHNAQHLRENMAAADIDLTPEQVRWLANG